MPNTVSVTSPVKLNDTEVNALRDSLGLTASDSLKVVVDPELIAGLKVTKNGKTVDLSVRQQLTEIATK